MTAHTHSHTHEKLHDEEIVVTKIKTGQNYFFRYAKKSSICLNEIGPPTGPTEALTFDKYEMCCSLLYQFNSVLQSHILRRLLLTPLLYFPCSHPRPMLLIYIELIWYYLKKNLFMLYKSSPPFQQQDQIAYHHHYW